LFSKNNFSILLRLKFKQSCLYFGGNPVNSVVCIKEVPDTETYIKIGADQRSISEANVTFIMNPYDEYAVEEALKVQESKGGQTTAITLGGERANEVLRYALAMGVNQAVRVKCDKPLADVQAAAKMIASVLKDMKFDLLFLGKETIDDGSSQLGPVLGELLDLPCITQVTKLIIGDAGVTAEREVSGGTEVLEASMPCIITTQKGINEPRYPSLRGKMTAKKAVIDEREVPAGDIQVDIKSMASPPARGQAKVLGGVEAVPELVRILRESKII
jgi:electron transfer flavoprotein beta subunit